MTKKISIKSLYKIFGKDPKSAMAKRKAITLPIMALNRYLSKLAVGSTSTDTQIFANLESALKTWVNLVRVLTDFIFLRY